MTKLIIFDWDDVFTLGAIEGYFACYRKAMNEVGVFLSPEEEKKRILAKWGKPFREELRELLKENPEVLDQACTIFEKEYWGDTFVNALKYPNGTNELLMMLQQQYTLAVASGNHPKMLKERIMPHFHIPQVFSEILTSHDIDDPEKTKPHPYMLETIMNNLQAKPEETIFVGDAKTDVLMAQSAHVTPVVVLTGHLTKEEAQSLGVAYIVANVREIETALDAIKQQAH